MLNKNGPGEGKLKWHNIILTQYVLKAMSKLALT